MRLEHLGLVDLSTDIETYLGFPIPRRFPGAITLRHLMTHSAGFESNHFGYMANWYPEDARSLADTVARNVPTQVRPPGSMPVYDNWGAAAAGRIIETVTGQRFDVYIEHQILRPLRMNRSTFEEPIPSAMGHTPVGFIFDGSDLVAHPTEHYCSVGPAGSFTTTAADMAKLMRVFLAGERHNETVGPNAIREMQTRIPRAHAQLNGMTLGLHETFRNGYRTVGHAGATVAFECQVVLVPDAGVGVFVASNTGGTGICEEIVAALFHHSCDAQYVDTSPSRTEMLRLGALDGRYIYCARSHTRSEKVFSSGHPGVTVATSKSGVVIKGLLSPGESHWRRVDVPGYLFRREGGDEFIAFEVAGNDVVLHGPDAANPLCRARGAESRAVAGFIDNVAPVLLAGLCLALGHEGTEMQSPALCAAAILAAIYLAILHLVRRAVDMDQFSLLVTIPSTLVAAQWLALLSVPLAVAVQWSTVLYWVTDRTEADGGKVMTGMAVMSAALMYWMHHWNLIRGKPWAYE